VGGNEETDGLPVCAKGPAFECEGNRRGGMTRGHTVVVMTGATGGRSWMDLSNSEKEGRMTPGAPLPEGKAGCGFGFRIFHIPMGKLWA
jgi:hypothetical protein